MRRLRSINWAQNCGQGLKDRGRQVFFIPVTEYWVASASKIILNTTPVQDHANAGESVFEGGDALQVHARPTSHLPCTARPKV